MFDHKSMKSVSDRYANPKSMPFTGEDQTFVSALRHVAKSFVQLQDRRHAADYDNGTYWNRLEAIDAAATAMSTFHLAAV